MATLAEAADRYAEITIGTAPKQRAVCLLHEKCAHCVYYAQFPSNRSEKLIQRAQNILSQLQCSLIATDTTSQGLFYLYQYCYDLLEQPTEEHLARVLAVLNPLKETFNLLHQNPR